MDLEKLRADWHRATEKDKPHDAVKALVELERLEPHEPRWSQRLGEAHRRLGHTSDAVDAFARAFDRYFARGFLPRAIAMAKLVRTLDAARGDLLEKSLPRGGSAVPPPLSFGGLLEGKSDVARPSSPPPPPPFSVRAVYADHSEVSPPKDVVKPPPLPAGDGPKPARRPSSPQPAVRAPEGAVSAPSLPPHVQTSRQLKVVKPVTLAPAEDSRIDEIRFGDAPESSLEILLVEFVGSDAVSLEVEQPDDDIDDDDAPPTRPVDMIAPALSLENAYASLAAARLFAALSRDALLALADASELVEFVPTAMVIVRDERAFALFTIVTGSARVIVPGSPEVRLGEGDVFGEGALLEEGKRQADVRAETDLMTLRIEKSRLDELTKQYPELSDALFDLLARRLVTNLMHTSPLFNSFEPDIRLELAQKFEVRRAEPGTVIAERGRRSDGLYVLLAGDVRADSGSGAPTRIARGTAFGHASLLGSSPSDVTIRAATEAVLLRMSSTGFAALAAHFPPALAHLAETAYEPLPESSREP